MSSSLTLLHVCGDGCPGTEPLAACGGAMQGPWLWGAPLSTPRTKAPWRSFFFFNVFIFLFFGLHRVVCGISVQRPGIATVPPASQAVLTTGPPGKKSCLLEILDVTAGLCPSAKPALRLGVHWLSGHPPYGTAAGGSRARGTHQGQRSVCSPRGWRQVGARAPGSPHAHEPSSTTDSGSLRGSQGLCLHHANKD